MKNYDCFVNFIRAVFIGIFGAVLLVIFFSAFMSIGTVGKLLPFVIGFNSILTGYNLVSRTKNSFKHKRIWGLVSGIVLVVLAVLVLNIIFYYLAGVYIVYMANFICLAFIGGFFSWLGAILAIKYFKLSS